MGANGFGYTQTAQIISVATQGAGGVYGVVQSAQSGNAAGIIAGALEAVAAAAAGIGMVSSDSTQVTLNQISAALGTAGIATSVASDFASGNLSQGLVDSLNLFLPEVAPAYLNDDSNLVNLTTVINDALDTPSPPQNSVSETATVQDVTYTVYEAPATTASPSRSGGAGSGTALSSSTPTVFEIVPAAAVNSKTLQAPLVMDFAAGGADISLALSPTSNMTDALAAIPSSPSEPGLGHPIGTLDQMATGVLGLIPLPRVLGIALGIYQAYQAAPTATNALLDQASSELSAPNVPTNIAADQIADQLEQIGGGVPNFIPTPKGASQFIFPNGTVLRFDIEPGQYLPPGQGPHINLQFVPGSPNPFHINLNP